MIKNTFGEDSTFVTSSISISIEQKPKTSKTSFLRQAIMLSMIEDANIVCGCYDIETILVSPKKIIGTLLKQNNKIEQSENRLHNNSNAST